MLSKKWDIKGIRRFYSNFFIVLYLLLAFNRSDALDGFPDQSLDSQTLDVSKQSTLVLMEQEINNKTQNTDSDGNADVTDSDGNADVNTQNNIINEFADDHYDLRTLIHDYDSNTFAIRAVERHIRTFTTKLRDRFSLWLSRAGMYIEPMKEILVRNGLPKELVFLPLIESGFSTKAYSRRRAVGPWQFIASTAKKYGLTINWWIDERRDPMKSTEAAARYLKDLYDMFNSWHLAMAAYNAGEARVLKALRKSNTDDHWKILQRKHLRRETREYVPKFVAASLIALEPQKYGFEDIEYLKPIEFAEVEIESPVDLEVIAKASETDIQTIKDLNPELKRWCTPPDQPTYKIRIPVDKKESFLQNLSSIPKEERWSYRVYTVKKGDTVSKIAKKHGLSQSVVYFLNPEIKQKGLSPAQTLKLPPAGFRPDPDDIKRMRKYYRKRTPSA